MAEFRVTVFDVERGLCVFARTPNNYGILIDCGRSSNFSPAAWIAKHVAPDLTQWNGHALYKLVVTHPHDDHVEDIDTVKAVLVPAVLFRHKNYDWDTVLNPEDGDPSCNAQTYYEWQQTYTGVITQTPDLGLEIEHFALTPQEAASIDSNPQHLLNNSSYVTVFTYTPPGHASSWKVVVAGDNETAGWEKLLQNQSFASAIKGADFYVTAHHGHESGFSADLFEEMGLPILNISSERSGDKSVFDYNRYARGTEIEGYQRGHLVTRHDSHITIRMTDEFRFSVEFK